MKHRRIIWFAVILISGIYAFVTFMDYRQSDYERQYTSKIKAVVTRGGEVEREIIDRGRSHVTKYYQDIQIQFENNGITVNKYCERVQASTKRGYKAGSKVTCYVDDENNVTFAYNVRDNLYGTVVAMVIMVIGIWRYIKAGKEAGKD